MNAPATKTTRNNIAKSLPGNGRAVSDRRNDHPNVQCLESRHAQLVAHQNFLSHKDRDLLISIIDLQPIPSSLYTGNEREGYRTSYSCNVDPHDRDIQRIEQSICDLVGLENSHSEVMQGQRYEVGQQFKDHHDFFHETEEYWTKGEEKNGGQRSWTAMVYLNEPEEGGATAFPQLEYQVEPRKGMLLTWNNMGPDG